MDMDDELMGDDEKVALELVYCDFAQLSRRLRQMVLI
jgi:hypothetical protein